MKKSPAVFAVLLILSAGAAFGQGSFLKRGETGLFLTGAYATSSAASGLLGTPGVSIGGVFDLSVGFGHAAYADSLMTDLEATTIQPALTLHAVKQNSSKSPFSLSFSVGYGHDTFSSPDLDEAGFTMTGTTLWLGMTFYRDVRLSSRIYLQPYLGGAYSDVITRIKTSGGQSGKGEDDVWSLNLGLPVVFGLSPRALIVLEPALVTDKNATTFRAAASLVYIVKTVK